MTTGLLVMSYGSPQDAEHIEQYYTHIRRGRPPSAEQLADLTARYEAIGGTSALARRTAEQVYAITGALEVDGTRSWAVELGTKHSSPSIEDAVRRLADTGARSIVGLVLAPHYSAASVGEYHRRATAAIAGLTTPAGSSSDSDSPTYVAIDNWHLLAELVEFSARGLRETLRGMPGDTKVVFTAHSLPERVLAGDPYPDQLFESAAATARRAGLADWAGWGIGWQSAGATPEPWRGPDLLEIIADLADTGRCGSLVVVPQGFTSDHLEVLYDIDIEAQSAARDAGLELRRTPVVNDDAGVMAALARLCTETAGGGPGVPR